MGQDPIADLLRKAPASDAIRAQAWQAFEDSSDEDTLAVRLTSLQLPDTLKAKLWEMKAASKTQVATTETPDILSGLSKATTIGRGQSATRDRIDQGVAAIPAVAGAAGGIAGRIAGGYPGAIAGGALAAGAGEFVRSGITGQTKGAIGRAATTGLVQAGGEAAFGGAAIVGPAMLKKGAEWAVRGAVKPTLTAMKQVAGASTMGVEATAHRLMRFIIDNGITTAEKAKSIIAASEREVQRLLSLNNAPTDAPARAVRYLAALEKNAGKQGIPGDDVAAIRSQAAKIMEGNLAEDVTMLVPTSHPTLVNAQGQPITVMVPKTTRQLRASVPADEALDIGRATSRWGTRKQFGELKGASVEANKAVDRAARDAVKDAVPETKPVFKRYARAITARDVIEGKTFQTAGTGGPGLTGGVEMATGHVPVIGLASSFLKANRLRLGVWAGQLENAIASGNGRVAAEILKRFGVGVSMQMLKPVASHEQEP